MEWKYCKVKKSIRIEKFYTAFEDEFSGGHVFAGESHDFWEIVYVLDGEVCVSADERVLNLEKNDIIFHKPLELHKFHIDRDKMARLFIMSFSASGEEMAKFENYAVRLSPTQKEYMFNMINLLRDTTSPKKYMSYTETVMESEHLARMLACSAELFLLSLHKSSENIPSTHNTPDAVIFKKAVGVMETSEWISVPELAVACNVSVSYLKKIFSKYSGLGVHKYFLKTKIIAATQMLKEGKTVWETALELGFCSQNYFSTVFKREMGISPQNYKNRYK